MSLGITAAGWAAIGAIGVTGASIYGSNKASSAQEAAAQGAQATSDRQFDITRQDQLALLAQQRDDQAPFREAGKSALAKIMEGVNGGQFSGKFNAESLNADPGYQFRVQQGEAGINRAAAATGAGYSGATLKALARFNSGQASQEYGAAFDRNTTQFNRLASLAGIGQTATNATQQAGTSAYGQIGQLGALNAQYGGNALMGAGEARASGYVANTNALGSGIKGLYNAYQMGPWTTGGGGTGTPYPDTVQNVII